MPRNLITVVDSETIPALLQRSPWNLDPRGRPASPRLVAIRNIGKKGGILIKEPDVSERVLRNRLGTCLNRENKRRAADKLPRLRTAITNKGLLVYAL